MRPKSKVYSQGDKALSDRLRANSKKRPKTDEERAIKKRYRDAKHDAAVKMAEANKNYDFNFNLNPEKPTIQKNFEDFGV